MTMKSAMCLCVIAAALAACSGIAPGWWRGDPNFVVPGIDSNLGA